MKCISFSELPPNLKFMSCSGQVMTDKEVEWQLEQAVSDEKYEWAAECRDELKRRSGFPVATGNIFNSEHLSDAALYILFRNSE